MDVENELKHWGILGMKWGVRRFQNDDGSLTPAGRERYGVGNSKGIKGAIKGNNDAGALSDDELYKMTKRYQKQADYYQARNNYVQQERYYKQLTEPKKKEHTFLKNVFVRPFESFLSKNAEFAYGALGYAVLGGEESEFATQYFNAITGGHLKTKEKEDPDEKEYKDKQKEYNKLKLENDIAEEKRKKTDPHIGETRTTKSGKVTTYYDQLNAYYEAKKKYEEARVKEAKLINTRMTDLYKDGAPSMSPDDLESLQRELDEYLERYGMDED